MTASDRLTLYAQLRRHEGRKRDDNGLHVPYRCPSGALTIGYGHNLDANPVPGLGADSRLTEEQAQRLLEIDALEVQERIERALPWSASLTAPRYAVLVNMAFNMGVGGLLEFKRMLAAVRAGEYEEAACEMLLNADGKKTPWYRQVKGRAEDLAVQMAKGVWQ